MRTATNTQQVVHESRLRTDSLVAIGIASVGLTTSVLVRSRIPAWAEMWLLAGCLFAFFKWLTWLQRPARCGDVGAKLQFGYLFGWVGLDVEEFCTPAPFQPEFAAKEWALAALKTVCGAAL